MQSNNSREHTVSRRDALLAVGGALGVIIGSDMVPQSAQAISYTGVPTKAPLAAGSGSDDDDFAQRLEDLEAELEALAGCYHLYLSDDISKFALPEGITAGAGMVLDTHGSTDGTKWNLYWYTAE